MKYVTDLAAIKELSATGRHQECLQACQNTLQGNPQEAFAYKYAGKSLLALGQLEKAHQCLAKAHQLDQTDPETAKDIGNCFNSTKNYAEAIKAYKYALSIDPNYAPALNNLGLIAKEKGDLQGAVPLVKQAIEIDPTFAPFHMNLGGIYKDLGKLDLALSSILKSLELKPNNATAHMKLGGIYEQLGKFDLALKATLKSLELKADNTDAYMNLGIIYKHLGKFDLAIASTLKSIEINPNNQYAIYNLNSLITQLMLSKYNVHIFIKAYEVLLANKNIKHNVLGPIFIQAFLSAFQAASKQETIISANNAALNIIAEDWRLRKSLTLLIPPHPDVEYFLTRFREELLILASQNQPIPDNLKPLSEALATQCFLNEYAYSKSPEEDSLVEKLIGQALQSQELFKQYLAIIACYIPIHTLELERELVCEYPITSYESETLIRTQFHEPLREEALKNSLKVNSIIDDKISVNVKVMYEENPYPRYRFADYMIQSLAKNITTFIYLESTKKDLPFSGELTNCNAHAKVLIAGCGTGSQVIAASRYKSAWITAIDLSSKSLAYAIRKAEEYGMENIDFKMMDLLDVANLQQSFDIIECSGVLHHMENPGKGLSALNEQLKPGGYIKLGLYSDIARQQIVEARNQIKELELQSTPEGIREFRQQVLRGEFTALSNLPQCGQDFYSLSGCRDLCFHVQEHRFTTESLQELLNSQGLIFCGFMLPEPIRKTYQKQFPNDTDMISLENWGEFEKQYPSTFTAMYQFWAYKPS